ncbi:MAG: EamA family transporter [Deltaproteobacteria bacterium]|nr:EamA family transporter [Deltaproteobacteria bacterium]
MFFSMTTRGVLACLGAAILFGANAVASKYLMDGGLSPLVLSQGRVTFAAILTVLWLGLKKPAAFIIRPFDIIHFLLLGSIGMAGVNACYFTAISKIPTAAAILIEYMAPALIAVFAWAFMHQRMGYVKFMALLLAMAGCYLVVGGYNVDLFSLNLGGLFWGLGAALTYSFYIVYSEYSMRTHSPWTVTCYALIVAAICYNIVLSPKNLVTMGWDRTSWTLLILSASLGTVVPVGLFAHGVELLRSTRATIVSTFEPIVAGLMAFLFLGERLLLPQIIGGLAVLTAVVLIQWEKEHDEMTPAIIKARKNT